MGGILPWIIFGDDDEVINAHLLLHNTVIAVIIGTAFIIAVFLIRSSRLELDREEREVFQAMKPGEQIIL
jgi:hypothetical protein